jgi:hypothetical protein
MQARAAGESVVHIPMVLSVCRCGCIMMQIALVNNVSFRYLNIRTRMSANVCRKLSSVPENSTSGRREAA